MERRGAEDAARAFRGVLSRIAADLAYVAAQSPKADDVTSGEKAAGMKVSTRYAVLAEWRSGLTESGDHPVPPQADLIKIADSWPTWPSGLSSAAEAWGETIEWLMRQLDTGVADPVQSIPAELASLANAGAADGATSAKEHAEASVAASASPATDLMPALRAWRDEATAHLPTGAAALTDSRLRLILGAPRSALEGLLPAPLRSRTAELAALLAARGAVTSESGAPEGSKGASAATSDASGATGPSAAGHAATAVPDAAAMPGAVPPIDEASGPAQRPSPQPSPDHGVPQSPGTDARLALSPEDFDEYDLGAHEGQEPAGITSSPAGEGWTIGWPRHGGGGTETVVFRLVSRDDIAPYAPESADLVTITAANRAVDDRPFSSAVRHYQVWRNAGPDLDSALHSQPVLHAQGVVVGRVAGFELREDAGRVVGRWTAQPGVERVLVHRVPVEQARFAGPNEEWRIAATEANLGGVVDTDVTRGATYVYLVYAMARVNGVTQLSNAPRRMEVTVSAVLAPVEDLAVVPHGDDDDRQFYLEWTDPPAGHVLVYRTQQAPRAGATNQVYPVSALPQMQLAETDRLPDPIVAIGQGRSGMRHVPWPRDWTRAYFTPVTVLNESAQVGATASATWVPPVELPRIVERVNREILTFAWPEGAASVLVYVGRRGAGAEAAMGSQPHEISESRYRELGGLTFPELLPPPGCSVHIVPVAFAAGERVEGRPVTVEYPGLLRLHYRSELKRGITGRPASVTVAVTSELALESPPPFVLVHHPERLPLDVSDGTALEVIRDGDETMATTRRFVPARLTSTAESRWTSDVKDRRGGFVRLFVDIPPAHLQRVALLDPPASSLSLQPRLGWRP